jgi:hypothetical protein
MKYDINNKTAPKMPTLGKGTECIQIIPSQASKDMHEPLVLTLFSVRETLVRVSDFLCPDLIWKVTFGQKAIWMAESEGKKSQLS